MTLVSILTSTTIENQKQEIESSDHLKISTP